MSSGIQGSILNLLFEWWGLQDGVSMWPSDYSFSPIQAANLVIGGNPPYQISDFLAVYPKFGTQPQGLVQVIPDPVTPGIGYVVGDRLTVVQQDASLGVVTVAAVGGGGSPTQYTVTIPGRGYQISSQGLTTTGGSSTGALVRVTQITSTNIVCIPPAVLQMYINLASACLQQARWFEYWPIAMSWFVAHFATLYLRSEGNVGSTAGQIASSGLTRGIMVTKSAGNVAATIEVPRGLDDWGAWTSTEYGVQLATTAKTMGMGGMWVL